MKFRNINMKIYYGILFLVAIVVSCTFNSVNSDIDHASAKGTLTGKIVIGPLCPVETNPPLPQCLPTEETYKAWAVAVWSKDKKSKIEVIKPNLDGTFKIEISANDYIIDFESKHNFAVGGSNLPISVSIEVQKTTEVNIDIDTGIR